MRSIPLSAAAVLSALLAACASGPDYKRPDMTLRSAYVDASSIAPSSGTEADAADWWQGFNDPKLAWAVSQALAQNLDLAQVQARVEQARAATGLSESGLLPTVEADGAAGRVRSSLKSPIGEVAHAVGAPRAYGDYTVGVRASWELDVFGGVRRGREAAFADEQAAEASAGAMRVSVAAEVADAYLTLRGLQARAAVLDEQDRVQTKLVDLLRLRVHEGLSADRELQHALAALEGVRASRPPLRAAIDGQMNRLDVLMGMQPGTCRAELQPSAAMPFAPQPTGSLTPADLLRRRPDVVAAEHRLIASNALIGSAVAEYYPHLSLGAALGFASVGTSNLLSSDAQQSQGIAGLRWRLFDFGRVDAEVAMARGRKSEMLAAYRKAIFLAAEDVETALSRLKQKRVEVQTLERQVAALRSARVQTQQAYQSGIVALIDVLDVDREVLYASDKLAAAQADEARASVAAFRALGGGWHS